MGTNWCIQKGVICDRVAASGYCVQTACTKVFQTEATIDLLARAEAAEARCETLEKMVKEYQDVIVPGYRERAEKAERERDAAVDQLRGDCEKCSHYKVTWNGCTPDFECPLSDRCLNGDTWEWVGIQKEE